MFLDLKANQPIFSDKSNVNMVLCEIENLKRLSPNNNILQIGSLRHFWMKEITLYF